MGDDVSYVTRGWVFTVDESRSQGRLASSYAGARRVAYNWAVRTVSDNMAQRRAERESGVPEDRLTPSVSWTYYGLSKRWNSVKDEVAPWWREVSMHAFRSGIEDASAAFENWWDWKTGDRKGPPVRFPRLKKKGRSKLTVSFVELNHQLSWLHPDRHHIRLMLPRASPDPQVRRRRRELEWLHTVESTGELYRLVESGEASIQKVTLSQRGGRWQVAFSVRHRTAPVLQPARRRGDLIAVDVGTRHLVSTSEPVPGLTDGDGHVANPKVLEKNLRRLRRLDRKVSRAQRGSKNHRKLVRRRARLHGRVAKTRAGHLHVVTTRLAGAYDTVAVEDLHVKGMANCKRHLGRALADASLGELRRQLDYKTADRGHRLLPVDRFFPSSKTCSRCGHVRAKLALRVWVFRCRRCGLVLDGRQRGPDHRQRSPTASARRTATPPGQHDQHHVAGLRP